MKKRLTYKKLATLINEQFGPDRCIAIPTDWYGGMSVIETNCVDDETTEEVTKFMKQYRTLTGNEFGRTCRNFKGNLEKWKEWKKNKVLISWLF